MQILKTIIVDDEPLAIETLQEICKLFCPEVEIIGTAKSPLEGIKLINFSKPDLVFLDIDMPGGTGFDVLEAFAERNFKVVFTTASSDFAIKAIKAKAEDYILKPIDVDELQLAIKKIIDNEKAVKASVINGKMALPSSEGLQVIDIDKIIRLEANDNYTWFYIQDIKNKILVSRTLKDFESVLDPQTFCRIHQSHLININFLDRYIKGRGGEIILKDGTHLDVSARKKDNLLDLLKY